MQTIPFRKSVDSLNPLDYYRIFESGLVKDDTRDNEIALSYDPVGTSD